MGRTLYFAIFPMCAPAIRWKLSTGGGSPATNTSKLFTAYQGGSHPTSDTDKGDRLS